MIQTWHVTVHGPKKIELPDASSLDAVTRQLPPGYYTTFRTYDSCRRVIGLEAHFSRLPHADAATLRRHLRTLLEPYRPGEARVRLMETAGGESYISIEPLKLPPPEVYEQGVRVETVRLQRINPREKTTAFIGASEAVRKKIAEQNIFEALLVKNGRILEGMTSNFFYVCQGILHTARHGILLGVTRTMVIRAARGIGVGVKYQPLRLDQRSAVSEAFITSSSRGIVPVVQIDEVPVGEGRAGTLTKRLSAAYEAYVHKKAETL